MMCSFLVAVWYRQSQIGHDRGCLVRRRGVVGGRAVSRVVFVAVRVYMYLVIRSQHEEKRLRTYNGDWLAACAYAELGPLIVMGNTARRDLHDGERFQVTLGPSHCS